jgi:hypothetical protein
MEARTSIRLRKFLSKYLQIGNNKVYKHTFHLQK